MDFSLIGQCIDTIIRGVPETLKLLLLALPLSFLLALVVVAMHRSQWSAVRLVARCYSDLFRGTPLLVQLYLAYYGTGSLDFIRDNGVLWWLFSDGFRCAVLVITLNSGAYISEILRGGLESVPKGLREAALATGMSRFLCFRRIEFPLAIRQALPAYSNEMMLLVKGTSLASTIAVTEIMSVAKQLFSKTAAPVEVFIAAGCFYLLINFILTMAVRILEKRLMRHHRA